jgi:hypothetical protein
MASRSIAPGANPLGDTSSGLVFSGHPAEGSIGDYFSTSNVSFFVENMIRRTARPAESVGYNIGMRRLALAILVAVGSLAAQNAPPPAAAEPSSLKVLNTSPSQVCVTPLLKAKVVDASRFALKVIVKSDSLNPKFVLKPPLPSCNEMANVTAGASNGGPGDHVEAPRQ